MVSSPVRYRLYTIDWTICLGLIPVISLRPVHLSMLCWSSFNEYSAQYTIFFPSHWLLSHITIVETTDSGERGMNPVAMTIINPGKEYWPSRVSNQRPPVLKFATLPTELWGSVRPGLIKPRSVLTGYSYERSQSCSPDFLRYSIISKQHNF